MEFTLENVLIAVIVLVTLNLLFIGFYIVKVLIDLRSTINRAGKIMDEVDEKVKAGLSGFNAFEKPFEAIAMTTNALSGVFKGAEVIRKATTSILGNISKNGEKVILDKPIIDTQLEKKTQEPLIEVKEKTSINALNTNGLIDRPLKREANTQPSSFDISSPNIKNNTSEEESFLKSSLRVKTNTIKKTFSIRKPKLMFWK